MASDQVSDFHLSSLLHPNHVVALQSYFSRTSDDPACQKLSLQQFTKALKKVLGPSSSTIPDDQLARMFNRIDANSDGSVTWDEWCDFFLLFDQRHINLYRDMHSSILQPRDGYSGKDPSIGTRHGVIEHILALLVPMELLKPPEWLYVTCARNGTVSLWDPTSLAVVGSLRPPNPTQWVTNMIALSVPNFVAVSVVDRFIYIIQLSSLSVVETLGPLAHAAVGMAAFRNADGGHMLAFGDMGGGLNLRTVRVVSSEKVAFVSPVRHVIHRDWVTQVTYLAAYRYLITASMDSSIKFSNLADGAVQRQFNCHRSGVYSFCYSPQLNLMASSGSRSVLLWNPDQMDVLASLQGHGSPVHQMVLDERAYKLFTLSMDKVLKVWDCYTYQCMQTIVDPTVHYPDDRIGRIFWDAKLLHLVSSTTRLRVWPIHTVLQSNTRTSHDCAISCATYTPALHQVATGDVRSAIHTWDASTGELVMRIPRAHGSNQITVVTYEFTGKRVLSGAADGSVHIWNASNGQLLSKLHRTVPVAGPMEVSGIVYVVPQVTAKSLNQDRYILVSGWDRQVVKYKDTKALDVYPLEVFTESTHTHSEDVVAMCYITPPAALVVSASVDGSIFLWSFTIRLLRHRLTLPSAQASYDMTFRVKAAGTAPDEPSDFVASFISGSNRGRIDMWCAESGSIKQSILATTTMGHGITSLALDDANAQLAAGNAAGDVHLWNLTNVAWYYSTPPPTQQKNATAALVRKWQHASLVSTWKAHSDGVVFIAHVSNLIVSAGRDGVLAVWSHRGHQMGIFGHDRVTLPREPCTTAPMDRPQLDDLKASAPPPLQRTLANKALRTLSPRVAGRLLPSDLIKPASARAMAAPQPASPRELRLKQTNHLTVHAVTDVPRKVHDFLHASLVDATEDEFRRKDAACNL
ncbi:hypothetical protein, variant 1 [Aphanomyces invadans]|uniref:EF-hand domain-containing protein n=1 Tax=Aphanomyces invadans TaxID=157072 RepID=A0A024UI53_9STRA|nr:hypothetical protein, variant 1 [Aphanomyces invadans]ETW06121.1 hypothetical protein, variant 1 [Aphanomyces invadans]|eukprot:XP_008865898.1 hypothetical protein, variant 1 [Aphanomyces invadans]